GFASHNGRVERNRQFGSQIGAATGLCPLASAGPTKLRKDVAEGAAGVTAKAITKHLAEVDIFGAGPTATPARVTASAARTCAGPNLLEQTAITVVEFPLAGIVQHVEGSLHLLKLAFGGLVVGVQIGMVLASQIPVGLLNVGRRGIAAHAQDF